MKTQTLFLIFMLFTIGSFAQEAVKDTLSVRTLSGDGTRYRASNGMIYAVGRTINIGTSTGLNNKFKHLQLMIGNLVTKGGVAATDLEGAEVSVLGLKQEKYGSKRVYAIFKNQKLKFAIFIEAGLASGEIK